MQQGSNMSDDERTHFCVFCLKSNVKLRFVEESFFKSLEKYFRRSFLPRVESQKTTNHNFGQLQACEDCEKIVFSYCALFKKMQLLERLINRKLQDLTDIMKGAPVLPGNVRLGTFFISDLRMDLMSKYSAHVAESMRQVTFQLPKASPSTYNVPTERDNKCKPKKTLNEVNPWPLQKLKSFIAIILLHFEYFKPKYDSNKALDIQSTNWIYTSSRKVVPEVVEIEEENFIDSEISSPPSASKIVPSTSRCIFRKAKFRCDEHFDLQIRSASELLEHYKIYHRYSSIYQCSVCHWPFLNEYKKEVHELEHKTHDQIKNQCPKCGKYFSATLSLQGHYYQAHSRHVVLQRCPKCYKHFEGQLALQSHLKMHLSGEVDSGPSENGEIEMIELDVEETDADIAIVEEMHQGDGDPESLTGPSIVSTDSMAVNVNNDAAQSTAKSNQSTYPCYLCPRRLKSAVTRKRHFAACIRSHNYNWLQIFTCYEDNYSFSTSDELLSHFQLKHKNALIYNCSVCQWPFLDKDRLELHQLVHIIAHSDGYLVEEKICCPKCEVSFSCAQNLQDHYNIVHGKKFPIHKCTLCPKGFSAQFRLQNHLRFDHKDDILQEGRATSHGGKQRKILIIKSHDQSTDSNRLLILASRGDANPAQTSQAQSVEQTDASSTLADFSLNESHEVEIPTSREEYNHASMGINDSELQEIESSYVGNMQFEDEGSDEWGNGDDDVEIGDVKVVRIAN